MKEFEGPSLQSTCAKDSETRTVIGGVGGWVSQFGSIVNCDKFSVSLYCWELPLLSF